MFRFSVRLRGIDTPELRSRCADEKRAAKIARDALRGKILHRVVELSHTSTEKYGRLLADVTLDGESINDWLVESR